MEIFFPHNLFLFINILCILVSYKNISLFTIYKSEKYEEKNEAWQINTEVK